MNCFEVCVCVLCLLCRGCDGPVVKGRWHGSRGMALVTSRVSMAVVNVASGRRQLDSTPFPLLSPSPMNPLIDTVQHPNYNPQYPPCTLPSLHPSSLTLMLLVSPILILASKILLQPPTDQPLPSSYLHYSLVLNSTSPTSLSTPPPHLP